MRLALTFLSLALAEARSFLNPRQGAGLAKITSASISGTGCPAGSFNMDIGPTNEAVTITYSSYQVLAGPNLPAQGQEKSCVIDLALNFPIGCTAVVFNTQSRIFSQIEADALGVFNSTYALSRGHLTGGDPRPLNFRNFTGNFIRPDTTLALVSISEASQQDVHFILSSNLNVTAEDPAANGVLSIDTVDIALLLQDTCP